MTEIADGNTLGHCLSVDRHFQDPDFGGLPEIVADAAFNLLALCEGLRDVFSRSLIWEVPSSAAFRQNRAVLLKIIDSRSEFR